MTNVLKDTKNRYFEGVGRRKTSTARVRLIKADQDSFKINDKKIEEYFPTVEMRERINRSLTKINEYGSFAVSVKSNGGGISSQTDAVIMGLGRAIVAYKPEARAIIKKEGMLTRDARAKERRKFGLKKARKSPQWSKR